MRAARAFVVGLGPALERVARVRAVLLGSLAFTGRGYATDKAVLLGLSGAEPDSVDPDEADRLIAEVD